MLGKLVISLIILLLLFATLCITSQVMDMSTETATSADGITIVAGSSKPAASSSQFEEQDSLSDAYGWKPSRLNGVKSLYLAQSIAGCTAEEGLYCPDGSELVSVSLL
jgi:hypothetical protein